MSWAAGAASMSDPLRKALDAIASGQHDRATPDHCEKVERLRTEFHHSIRFIGHGTERQRCFDYVLDIHPDLIADAYNGKLFKPFIAWYCDKSLIKDPNGEIVIYFDQEEPKHAGFYRDQRIISKWGSNPIYEHGIKEVPASYGDTVLRYRRPSQKEANRAFIKFVRGHPRYVDCVRFESTVTDLGLAAPGRDS
jgi:hypothetical protein